MRKKAIIPVPGTLNSVLTSWWSRQTLKQNFGMQWGIAISSPISQLRTLGRVVNHFETEFYPTKNLSYPSLIGSLILFNKTFLTTSCMSSMRQLQGLKRY